MEPQCARSVSRTAIGFRLARNTPDFRSAGLHVVETEDEGTLFELVRRMPSALVLIGESTVPNWSGLELVERLYGHSLIPQCVLFSSAVPTDYLVRAARLGVSDLISTAEDLSNLLARVAEEGTEVSQGRLIGSSIRMRELRRLVRRAATCDCNVLITGETGSGKELVARSIHETSPRAGRPFVAVNCAAIPQALMESELFGHERGAFTGATTSREGKLQSANGGSVLLDEIGDMEFGTQAKLLRTLETRAVERLGSNRTVRLDVRFLSATHQDLDKLILTNRFRADLMFRLNVLQLHVPPLRERTEDIPELVEHLVSEIGQGREGAVQGVHEGVLELFAQHSWPGNVRELKNTVEAACFMTASPKVSYADLPLQFRRRFAGPPVRTQSEEARLMAALTSAAWNKSEAARVLNCSRMTLYRKMAQFGIHE